MGQETTEATADPYKFNTAERATRELNGGRFHLLYVLFFCPLSFQHRYKHTLVSVLFWLYLFTPYTWCFPNQPNQPISRVYCSCQRSSPLGHLCRLLKRRLVKHPQEIKSIHLLARVRTSSRWEPRHYVSWVYAFIILMGGDQWAPECFSLPWARLNRLWIFLNCGCCLAR